MLVTVAAANSKQYPMAGEVHKEKLLLLSNVIARRLWLFQTATGFACGTLVATLVNTVNNNIESKNGRT